MEKSLFSKCISRMWNNIMLVEEFIKKIVDQLIVT